MHQRKSKKILIYFLLFLIVGSINNIKFNKINISNISNIKIIGLGKVNNNFLLKKIKGLKLENIFFINENDISYIIESNSLVEKYDIFKIYPSSLYINIQKTKFLARINQNGKNLIVGSNGKFSNNKIYNDNLPFIFGNPQIKEFLKFKEIIDNSKIEYKEIKNIYYFSTGRWDLELNNDIIIKLPEKNIEESLKLVFEFLSNNEITRLKVIDARIKNQIIVNG